ncbi:hypothetical protein CLU79DRAFT_834555 [Phycomyces nitens]|nr:hypothetical protein CLU79DRAFT_834555 [Phycomyces nitens]
MTSSKTSLISSVSLQRLKKSLRNDLATARHSLLEILEIINRLVHRLESIQVFRTHRIQENSVLIRRAFFGKCVCLELYFSHVQKRISKRLCWEAVELLVHNLIEKLGIEPQVPEFL